MGTAFTVTITLTGVGLGVLLGLFLRGRRSGVDRELERARKARRGRRNGL